MVIKKLGRLPPGTKLFLAEGQSEVGLIEAILKGAGAQDECSVFCFGGLGQLGTVLKGIAGLPGFDQLGCLGLILDAETDFNARVTSVISHFSGHGVTLTPEDILECKTTMVGSCRIGVFISPGDGLHGRIEDNVMQEIETSDLFTCIQSMSECVEAVMFRKLDKKAVVQIYISALKGDLCGIGRAFDAGILKVEHHAYDGPRGMVAALVA